MSEAAHTPPRPDPAPEFEQLLASALRALNRKAPGLLGALLRQRCRTSDLVQSALVDAIRSFPRFRGHHESEFVGWTMRIMERNSLDRRRRLLAEKRSIDRDRAAADDPDGLASDQRTPSQLVSDREQLLRVARAMRRLPTDQRRVLQLVALRGRSHAEVAAQLGRSEGACRVLLARARAALLVTLARQAEHGRR
ncbi:MAG TPA: sigma-70 family RNA polymerase sigma factor [Planctomycetota bacterium]|nr:sigma-70 family RNA polymerase sigma factor [Planctomycetota bacterium]